MQIQLVKHLAFPLAVGKTQTADIDLTVECRRRFLFGIGGLFGITLQIIRHITNIIIFLADVQKRARRQRGVGRHQREGTQECRPALRSERLRRPTADQAEYRRKKNHGDRHDVMRKMDVLIADLLGILFLCERAQVFERSLFLCARKTDLDDTGNELVHQRSGVIVILHRLFAISHCRAHQRYIDCHQHRQQYRARRRHHRG